MTLSRAFTEEKKKRKKGKPAKESFILKKNSQLQTLQRDIRQKQFFFQLETCLNYLDKKSEAVKHFAQILDFNSERKVVSFVCEKSATEKRSE